MSIPSNSGHSRILQGWGGGCHPKIGGEEDGSGGAGLGGMLPSQNDGGQQRGHHLLVLELLHLLLMGVHLGLLLCLLPGQLQLRRLWGDTTAAQTPQTSPRDPSQAQPSTHQLQLLLLPLLEPGQVLGQVGAAELVPQAPGDVQHLPGDATEGHSDLVHQLPVPREVIVGGTAQVCLVAPADRSGDTVTTPGVPNPELSPLCHPPQAALGGFSCLDLAA